MRMKFTEKTISALRLKAGQTDLFAISTELAGFHVSRLRPGSAVWLFQYKIGGRSRKVTIGSAAAIGLAAAKKIAGEYHARVMAGGDPAADKIDAIADRALDVGMLVNKYIAAQKSDWRPRTYVENDRYLRRQMQAATSRAGRCGQSAGNCSTPDGHRKRMPRQRSKRCRHRKSAEG